MIYYFKVQKADRGYWGYFPDLEGTRTQGDTLQLLLSNARDALNLTLETSFDFKCRIPFPKRYKGRDYYPIACDPTIGFPIILRKTRLAKKWTQKEMADKMDIALSAYQRLETPGKANPTIKTLEKLRRLINLPMDYLFERAA